jgi:O-antigen/teichoic acid export membrane protein
MHSRARSFTTDPSAAGEPNLARRLFHNYVFQLINQIIFIGQQIILVPLFLRAWGIDAYANWNVLFSVTALVLTFNLGLEYYFAAVLLKHSDQRGRTEFNRQLKVALFCASTIATTVFIIFICGVYSIDLKGVLHIDSIDEWTARTILTVMALPVLVLLPAQILHGVYRALGDFNRGECVFGIYNLAQLAAVVGMLLFRQPPWVVAICYLVVPFLFGIGLVADLLTHHRQLELGLAIPTKSEIRAAIPQCCLYFLDPLAALFVQHGPILIFGVLNASSTAIVSYTAYRTFTGLARQTANQFAVGGGIEMARQLARGENAACRDLYHNTGQVVACLVGTLAGICIPLSHPFVLLWTRGAVGNEKLLLACFLAGAFAAAPGQAALVLLRYTNRARACAGAWSGHSVGGLALAVMLIPFVGVAGAAAGFAISEFVAVGLYLTVHVQREFGFSAVTHWARSYLAGMSAFVLSYALADAILVDPPVGLPEVIIRSAIWAAIIAPPVLLFVLRPLQCATALSRIKRLLPPLSDPGESRRQSPGKM